MNNQNNQVLDPQLINPGSQNDFNNQTPMVNNPNNNRQIKQSGGNGFLKFLIIVLLICCLGLGGYIAYSKLAPLKEEKAQDAEEAIQQVKIDGNSILEAEDIIKTFETAFNDHYSKFFGFIYDKNEVKGKGFDKYAALYAAIYEYLEESTNVTYVANSTVKAKHKSLFGNSVMYNPSNLIAGDNFNVTYNANTNYYAYQRVGDGAYFYPTYVTFNESSSISKEKIEIVKRVGYVEFSADHTKMEIYKDKAKTAKVGELPVVEGAFSPDEIEAKFKSSLAQYKYSFIKGRDHFVFESITRTK